MNPVDREGIFRATIEEYGLKQMDSGSVAIAIRCKLTEQWNPREEAWDPWAQYDQEAEGDVWIVKKDGHINEGAAKSLMQHAGWDGSIEAVSGCTWTPTPIQVTISREVYKEKERFKIAFVNEHARTPGAMSNVNGEKAKYLNDRFGAQLRAIHGNVNRNGIPSSLGGPAEPPVPATPPRSNAPTPPPADGQPEEYGAKIPF